MKTRTILSLGLSAVMVTATAVGVVGMGGTAAASERGGAAAAKHARDATKALAKRDVDVAIREGEAAVALMPREVSYRMTLAQAYLQGGRFESARQGFADVLTLQPGNARAALDLALAQTATGDWGAARRTLDANATAIPAADLGLALALAGDPKAGAALLMQAARAPGADAKVRQNLGLALALGGDWGAARLAASADMAPADVDARMVQWAALAHPTRASDQVAALLGIVPATDSGVPVALALNAPVAIAAGVTAGQAQPLAIATPVSSPMPPVIPAPVAVPTAISAPATVAAPALVAKQPVAAPSSFASVVFAPRREVVQSLPTPLIRSDAQPAKVPLAAAVAPVSVRAKAAAPAPVRAATPATGDWFVQLGAYSNAAVARDGWTRATRRFASLAGHVPSGMTFASRDARYYRLSVGGFSRADADRMCRTYRAHGGACFVRRNGGDAVAQWVGKRVELAAR